MFSGNAVFYSFTFDLFLPYSASIDRNQWIMKLYQVTTKLQEI